MDVNLFHTRNTRNHTRNTRNHARNHARNHVVQRLRRPRGRPLRADFQPRLAPTIAKLSGVPLPSAKGKPLPLQ
jgi:hypothetical protein